MPAGAVLVVTRFIVPDEAGTGADSSPVAEFQARSARLQAALSVRPGYLRSQLARALDDPSRWVLVSEWVGVGAWRRALGDYDVRMEVIPLMAMAQDEPGVYETPDA
jgi:heme oxygenase (mycobilin-producing)